MPLYAIPGPDGLPDRKATLAAVQRARLRGWILAPEAEPTDDLEDNPHA